MSDESRVVLHIPIQINGGSEVPGTGELFDRELFLLDDGTLYVSNEGEVEVVIGRIKDESTLNKMKLIDPTVEGNFTMNTGKLILPGAIVNAIPSEAGVPGQIVFVDANPST